MPELITLHFRSRKDWRAWLAKHHVSSPGIWCVFYKGHTGQKSIPYEDMVREALCFGWIDSLIKRLDDDRYAIKVTPSLDFHTMGKDLTFALRRISTYATPVG